MGSLYGYVGGNGELIIVDHNGNPTGDTVSTGSGANLTPVDSPDHGDNLAG